MPSQKLIDEQNNCSMQLVLIVNIAHPKCRILDKRFTHWTIGLIFFKNLFYENIERTYRINLRHSHTLHLTT